MRKPRHLLRLGLEFRPLLTDCAQFDLWLERALAKLRSPLTLKF